VLALSRGEDQEYQQACAKMVEQASASDDDTSRRFAVWACCLGAEAVSSYEPVIVLARTGVQQHPDSQQDRINLGGILMRAGQFEEARKVLDHPTAAATDETSSAAYVHYFLAMTQHHLGNASEAALQLRRANDLADQDQAATTSWRRKVSLELLRKEAGSLISFKE
jgi:tetratricopeptide (TPR) repeat protein